MTEAAVIGRVGPSDASHLAPGARSLDYGAGAGRASAASSLPQ